MRTGASNQPAPGFRAQAPHTTARCRLVLVTTVLGLAIAACGGGGLPAPTTRPTGELPTVSITAAPSRSSEPDESSSRPPRTSITLPTRSEAVIPAPIPTQLPPPTPAPTPAPSPAPAPALATASTSGTTTAPTGQTSPATRAPVSTAPSAAPSSTSSSSWLGWLLGGLLIVLITVVIVIAVRARRSRQAWEGQLTAVVAETTWLAHELLPIMLSNQDAAARRATWTAYRPRVETLMTILNQAATSAPQDRRSSLDQLHTAVSALTSAVDAYTTTPPPVDRENLGAIQEAQHWTEEALRAIERAQHSIT
jgi:hypothetical protein